MLLFEDKLNANLLKTPVDQFKTELLKICTELHINPNDLMLVMYNESGINPARQNYIKATGLIQWLPNTLKDYNLTPEQVRQMNGIQQLKLVKKYYFAAKGKLNNVYDLYLYTFYPYALNKPNDYIIGSEKGINYAKLVYEQNKPLGNAKTGFVTKNSFKEYIYNKYGKLIDKQSGTAINSALLIIGIIAISFLIKRFV